MTVTINQPKYVTRTAVLLTYSSDLPDPVYRIYVNSVLVSVSSSDNYLLNIQAGQSPVIEITDDGAEPELFLPQKLQLSWRGVPGAQEYRIENDTGTGWTFVNRVAASSAGHYNWLTGVLQDGVTYNYRIVPVGVNGNEGDPLSFVVTMVRNPAPPAAAWVYDEVTKVLTATAI